MALLGDALCVLGRAGGDATGPQVGAVGSSPFSLVDPEEATSSFPLVSESATGDDASFLNIPPHLPATFLHKLWPNERGRGKGVSLEYF